MAQALSTEKSSSLDNSSLLVLRDIVKIQLIAAIAHFDPNFAESSPQTELRQNSAYNRLYTEASRFMMVCNVFWSQTFYLFIELPFN
ncbi:MAG: hypothetical protein DCF32_13590 [Leptolyngbya sp.]|nr:MAG: hypothetical protein DCF32_13590 [Leptolyngbya sp.]